MKHYNAPQLKAFGSIATLTGFSSNATEQDTIITPNGPLHLPGPASEFACQIPQPTAEECL